MQHISTRTQVHPVIDLRARQMRSALTPSEQKLWDAIRGGKLGVCFRRRFHSGVSSRTSLLRRYGWSWKWMARITGGGARRMRAGTVCSRAWAIGCRGCRARSLRATLMKLSVAFARNLRRNIGAVVARPARFVSCSRMRPYDDVRANTSYVTASLGGRDASPPAAPACPHRQRRRRRLRSAASRAAARVTTVHFARSVDALGTTREVAVNPAAARAILRVGRARRRCWHRGHPTRRHLQLAAGAGGRGRRYSDRGVGRTIRNRRFARLARIPPRQAGARLARYAAVRRRVRVARAVLVAEQQRRFVGEATLASVGQLVASPRIELPEETGPLMRIVRIRAPKRRSVAASVVVAHPTEVECVTDAALRPTLAVWCRGRVLPRLPLTRYLGRRRRRVGRFRCGAGRAR